MRPRNQVLRRLAAAIASCLVVLVGASLPAGAAFVPPYTPTFPDVPTTHPFYLEIEWLAAEGITTGYADGLYKPVNPVTRQAIAAFIYRYENGPGTPPACPTAPFTDVPKTHTFCPQIRWAKEAGIVKGYPDGSFRPVDAVARQALAAFMYRLAGSPNGTHPGCATAPFPDVPKNHAFCGEISWAKSQGIVDGYADGTFKPANPVTRQAFAAILYDYDLDFGTSSLTALGAEGYVALDNPTGDGSAERAGPGDPNETAIGAIVRGTNGAITGNDATSIGAAAILLAGGGALLVIGARRRRRQG